MNAPEPLNILRGVPVPRKRHFWTTAELATLRAVYPAEGAEATARALPGRSLGSIYTHAQTLGLKAPQVPHAWREKKYADSDAIDAQIRQLYLQPPVRGAVGELAARLHRPTWWIARRATHLGLKNPRFKQPDWTDAEDELLEQLLGRGHTLSVVARKMRAAGFDRGETACAVRASRLSISRRGDGTEAWSATQLARLMGVNASTVAKLWIRQHGLSAKRRGTERTEAQGGDEWVITRRCFRAWLKDNAQAIDLRKVDKFWFWTVIFND